MDDLPEHIWRYLYTKDENCNLADFVKDDEIVLLKLLHANGLIKLDIVHPWFWVLPLGTRIDATSVLKQKPPIYAKITDEGKHYYETHFKNLKNPVFLPTINPHETIENIVPKENPIHINWISLKWQIVGALATIIGIFVAIILSVMK